MDNTKIHQKVEAQAQQAVTELLDKFPEIASVAVVVDWDLPGWAGDAMPAAVWIPRETVAPVEALARMSTQLGKAIGMLVRVNNNHVQKAIEATQGDVDDTKPTATDS